VEPSSLAVVACRKTGDRSGAAWTAVLAPFANLEFVISDAGTGIAGAVQTLRAARPDVTLEHGLDLFHTAREAQIRLNAAWRRAEAVWDAAAVASTKTAAAKQRGQYAHGPALRERNAWQKAKRSLAAVEQMEAAWRRIHAALSLFRPDGRLNERSWAAAEIAAALPALSGAEWKKLRNFLGDHRSLAFLDRVQRRLAAAVPEAALREACVRRWWLSQQHPPTTRSEPTTVTASLEALLDERIRTLKLSGTDQESYEQVSQILGTTVRSSSAVEGMNSVLRMQQSRHRRMTQGMLDLKRLYWNCRKLHSGPRRNRSPYELLGVALPSTDFWTLLQMPLAELQRRTQGLSIPPFPE
jgi:hypothetical protein